jgi:peptidoglycan/LPS O-acetylase OafA/YrhL
MRYNPALDGLRAFAVLAVMVHHGSYGAFSGGVLGVDIFFALSGYLITTTLVRGGRIDFSSFYLKRMRRLGPALLAALLFTGLIWRATIPRGSFFDAALPSAFYYANWVAVIDEARLGALLPLWSLSVEEQFYLMWPVGLYFLLGRTANVRRAAVGAGLVVVILLVTRAGFHLVGSPLASYFSTLARIDEILVGAVFALAQRHLGGSIPWLATSRGSVLALGSALGILALTIVAGPHSKGLYLGGFTGVALLSAILVLHVENAPRGALARLLSAPGLVAVGKRSYGLYLFHMPIFDALERLRTPHSASNFIGVMVVRMAIAFAVAWASYRFIEAPFLERRGARRPSASKPIVTVDLPRA